MKNTQKLKRVVETVTTVTDLKKLESIFNKDAAPKELPYLRRYLRRLMKEGTKFMYVGGLKKNEKAWQYARFEVMFRMATVTKTLDVKFE